MKTTCIMCPLGCELDIKKQANGEIKVSGNSCIRGEKYAISELTNPVRNISSLIKAGGGVVAVKTTAPVPKDRIEDCLKEISKINLKFIPQMGTIVIKNILNLGVDVVSINI